MSSCAVCIRFWKPKGPVIRAFLSDFEEKKNLDERPNQFYLFSFQVLFFMLSLTFIIPMRNFRSTANTYCQSFSSFKYSILGGNSITSQWQELDPFH